MVRYSHSVSMEPTTGVAAHAGRDPNDDPLVGRAVR
jgi:hypothetical protein